MKLYVYHTPELLPAQGRAQCAVAIDVLRASTTIATALNSGAEAIQVFSDIDELFAASEAFPEEKRLRAGERGGRKVAKCDLGNSPLDCTPEQVEGKRLFLSTTNGTRCLQSIETSSNVIVAALVNRQAVVDYLLKKKPGKVWLVGSGWEGEYSLEDTICAGAIADGILEQSKSSLQKLAGNDELIAAVALYRQWKGQLPEVMALSSHGQRLLRLRGQQDVAYCCQLDTVGVLPIQKQKGVLIVRQPGFFEKLFSGRLFGGKKQAEQKQLKDAAADKGQEAAEVSKDSQKALKPVAADKDKAEKTKTGKVEKAKALQPAKGETQRRRKPEQKPEKVQGPQKQKKSGMTMTPIAEVFSGFGKMKKAGAEQKKAETLPPSKAPVKMDTKAEVQKAQAEVQKAKADKAKAEAKAKAEIEKAEAEKAKAEAQKVKADKAKAEADRAKAEKVKAEAKAKAEAGATKAKLEKTKEEAQKAQAQKAKADAQVKVEADKAKAQPVKPAEAKTEAAPMKPTDAAGSKSVEKTQTGTTTVKAESVKVEPAKEKDAGQKEPKLAVSQVTPAKVTPATTVAPATGSVDSPSVGSGSSTPVETAAGGEKKANTQSAQKKDAALVQSSQSNPLKKKEEPSEEKPKDNGKKQTQEKEAKNAFEPPTLEDAKKILKRLIK